MSSVKATPMNYAAATGARSYDEISWSAPPISNLVAVGSDGVQAIRHRGSNVKGTLQTRSRGNQRPDSLMMAELGCGVFEARAGGAFKASQQSRDLCCYLPHGIDADLEFPSRSRALVLHFPPGLLARHCFAVSPGVSDPVPGFRDPALGKLMVMIEQELLSPGFGYDLLLEGLYRCVASVLARASEQPLTSTQDRLHMSPVKLQRVRDYVETNLAEKLTIKELADVAGISMFHFARVFKRTTNLSPYQYVRSRRLLRAQSLMEMGQISLVEIGLSCGFANQSHFTSAFQKETGMSPGRYRRLLLADG